MLTNTEKKMLDNLRTMAMVVAVVLLVVLAGHLERDHMVDEGHIQEIGVVNAEEVE